MKKSLLLLMAGASFAAANAQVSNNMLFTKSTDGITAPAARSKVVTVTPKTANKTTAGSHSAWFSFQDAQYNSAVSKSYITTIYNDSTLYVPGGTPSAFYYYIMGLGTSFDPTSSAFAPGSIENTDYIPADFVISNTNAYTVDSIAIAGRYDRLPYNNYTDTLNIYLVAASGTGAYKLAYNKDVYFSTNLAIPDSQLHVATANYDSVNNKIASSATGVIKIQKILDAAAFADSSTTGLHSFAFALPSTMSLAAGQKIVAYQQFVSGHNYRFGMDIDSANTYSPITYEINGTSTFPHQKKNDYNSGLIVTSAARYNVDTAGDYYMGNMIMSSTYIYGAAAHFDDPYFAFHTTCASCILTGVNNTASQINEVKAYPNPATAELNITFAAANNTNATITLTNVMGQVVSSKENVTNGRATFNTRNLPAGIYVFSVIANGERSTGRVTVAH